MDYILRIVCPDAKGLVHKVSGVLYNHDLNVESMDEYVSPDTQTFFMRIAYSGTADTAVITKVLGTILPDANISLSALKKKKVLIFATKEHHCLSDLLIRNEFQDLPFEVLGVISNHNSLESFVQKFNLPFHYIPAQGLGIEHKQEHEEAVRKIVDTYDFDYLILAKYMRILTPEFTQAYKHKIINIHHSFLPAFIGASPYRQAHTRGVKIIGATAHFVTDELDEGPIIYQNTLPVNHGNTVEQMIAAGRDIEKLVLANALKLVFEDRVFITGNKTIVFE